MDFPWQTGWQCHNQMLLPPLYRCSCRTGEHMWTYVNMMIQPWILILFSNPDGKQPRWDFDLASSWGTWYATKNRCIWKWIPDTLQPLPFYLENDESRQIREKATSSIPKTWNVYETSVLWIKRPRKQTLLQKLVWYWIWHSNNDHEFYMTGRYREMGLLSTWSKVGKHLHRSGKAVWKILWFPLGQFSIQMGFENFPGEAQKKLPSSLKIFGFSMIWKQNFGVPGMVPSLYETGAKCSDHLIIFDLSIRKHHHLVKENLVYIYKPPSLYIIVTYFTIHSNHYNLVFFLHNWLTKWWLHTCYE